MSVYLKDRYIYSDFTNTGKEIFITKKPNPCLRLSTIQKILLDTQSPKTPEEMQLFCIAFNLAR